MSLTKPAARLATLVTACLLAVGLSPASAQPVGVPVPAHQGGRVVAWGYETSGETSVPPTLTDHNVVAVAAGLSYSLALTTGGHIFAWGATRYGATRVPAHSGVTAIAAGVVHALAINGDGRVIAWGDNEYGQTSVPSSLHGRTVTAIAAGRRFSMALTSDGTITVWGYDEFHHIGVPDSLTGKTVVAIAASYSHALALTSDGVVTAWGSNTHGESTVPASLTGKTVTAIAAGTQDSMAATSDGQVVVWGTNDYRQREVPASLQGKTVTAMGIGWGAVAAVTSDGKVTGWGDGMPGGEVTHGRFITAIALGVDHVLAVGRVLHSLTAPSIPPARIGYPVTAEHGTWTEQVASYAYAWKVDGVTVGSHATYTPTPEQYGKQLAVAVTATATAAHHGTAHATSQSVTIDKGDFGNVPNPTITGVRELGRRLTASLTGVTPAPDSVTFVWKRRDVVVGHGATYTPSGADYRSNLHAVATVQKHGFHNVTVFASTGLIAGCTTYC